LKELMTIATAHTPDYEFRVAAAKWMEPDFAVAQW
jgi:hypothetical protein